MAITSLIPVNIAATFAAAPQAVGAEAAQSAAVAIAADLGFLSAKPDSAPPVPEDVERSVERVSKVYSCLSELSRENDASRDKKGRFKDELRSIAICDAMTGIMLAEIEQMSKNLMTFYAAAADVCPDCTAGLAWRKDVVADYLSRLPKLPSEIKLEGKYRFQASLPESHGKSWARYLALLDSFIDLVQMNELSYTLKDVAARPRDAKNQPFITALREVIADTVLHSIFLLSVNTPKRSMPLSRVMPILDEHFNRGVHSVVSFKREAGARDPLVPNGLTAIMLRELVANAWEASIARLGDGRDLVDVNIMPAPGGTAVRIEDFGYPKEFRGLSGIGHTTKRAPRAGMGIGIYKAYLLSRVAGHEIFYAPKADFSGSFIYVKI